MRPTKASAIASLLGGSAFAVTLMACYGVPPGNYAPGDDRVPADPSISDGDAGADAGNATPDGGTARDAQADAVDASDDDAGDAN
jgi:hypothetical protein